MRSLVMTFRYQNFAGISHFHHDGDILLHLITVTTSDEERQMQVCSCNTNITFHCKTFVFVNSVYHRGVFVPFFKIIPKTVRLLKSTDHNTHISFSRTTFVQNTFRYHRYVVQPSWRCAQKRVYGFM